MSERLQKDFLEMLNQCQGIVMKVCLCFTDRQPANIDDLYQDIVSELWTSYPRFRQESKPSTWVYAVALNTALMRHRPPRPQGPDAPLPLPRQGVATRHRADAPHL